MRYYLRKCISNQLQKKIMPNVNKNTNWLNKNYEFVISCHEFSTAETYTIARSIWKKSNGYSELEMRHVFFIFNFIRRFPEDTRLSC